MLLKFREISKIIDNKIEFHEGNINLLRTISYIDNRNIIKNEIKKQLIQSKYPNLPSASNLF